MAKRLDTRFGYVFRNLWWPRSQSYTGRMLVVQEWAEALKRNKVSGKEAHAALNHCCDHFSKPPSIAEFLEQARKTRSKPLAHRPYRPVEDRVIDKNKREKSMQTADHFLKAIYKDLQSKSQN